MNPQSTQTYLKRFDEEMLKVKELIESIAFEDLISGVKEWGLWKELYALPNKSLLKVKYSMKNHIQVKKVSVEWHESLYFYKKKKWKEIFQSRLFF